MSLQFISIRGSNLTSRRKGQAFYVSRNDGNFSAQVGDYHNIVWVYDTPAEVLQIPRPMILTWIMNELSHRQTHIRLGRFFTGPWQSGKFEPPYKHCPDIVWAGNWLWSNEEWQAYASMVVHNTTAVDRANNPNNFRFAPEQLTCDGSHMLTDGSLINPDLKVIPIWIRDDTGVDKPYFFADLTEKKQPGVVISIRGNETWVATVQDWIGEFPEEIVWPEDFDSDGYSAVALKTDFPAGSSLHKIVKGDPCQQLAYWLWEQFTPYSPAVTTLDEVMMWSEHVRPYPPPFNVHAMTPMADYKPRNTRLRGAHWANDYGDSEHKRKYI